MISWMGLAGNDPSLYPAARLTKKVVELTAVRNTLTRAWKLSPFYAEQVSFMRSTLLKLENLQLNSAICLGLGQLRPGLPASEAWILDERFTNHDPGILGAIGSISQLIVFECWIDILRRYSLFGVYYHLINQRFRRKVHDP